MKKLLPLLCLLGACHPTGPVIEGSDGGPALVDGGDRVLDAGTDGALAVPDGGSPVATGDFCLEGGWCWQRPLQFGTTLDAVWGSGPSDVWAVGAGGTAVHWNGTKWALVPTGTRKELFGVWGADATHVWMVGAAGTILRWDGAHVSAVASPTTSDLAGVGGSSATNVFAVGAADTRLHFDGNSWTQLPTVYPGLTSAPGLTGVWTSGGDVFTSGVPYGDAVVQENAGTWKTVYTDDTGEQSTSLFSAVWGASDSDVWMVGSPASGDQVQHWDGTAWKSVVVPAAAMLWAPTSVTGTSATDVWFFGGQQAGARWDGTSFIVQSDLLYEYLQKGWVDPSGEGWVVGWAGRMGHKTTLGGGWTFVSGATEATYDSLSAISVLSENDAWAVGRLSLVHWDGSTWSDVAPATTTYRQEFNSVWGSASDDVWVTSWGSGSPDNLQHWDGTSWKTVAHAGPSYLNAVWGAAADDVWVLFDGGGMHFDGTTWTSTVAVSGGSAISGTGHADIWAVGEGGTISHYDGTTWTKQTSGTTNDLWSVLALSPTDVWVAGNESTLLHWNGTAWVVMTAPTVASDLNGNHGLTHIVGTSDTDLWASSLAGEVFHWDGATWTLSTNSTVGLSTIAQTPSGALFVAGGNGAILRKAP